MIIGATRPIIRINPLASAKQEAFEVTFGRGTKSDIKITDSATAISREGHLSISFDQDGKPISLKTKDPQGQIFYLKTGDRFNIGENPINEVKKDTNLSEIRTLLIPANEYYIAIDLKTRNIDGKETPIILVDEGRYKRASQSDALAIYTFDNKKQEYTQTQ